MICYVITCELKRFKGHASVCLMNTVYMDVTTIIIIIYIYRIHSVSLSSDAFLSVSEMGCSFHRLDVQLSIIS